MNLADAILLILFALGAGFFLERQWELNETAKLLKRLQNQGKLHD